MARKKYTPQEVAALLKRPRGTLNPSEFLAVFKAESQAKKGNSLHGTSKNTDNELFEVFEADPKAEISANQFKQAVGRAGLSISHDRAATLHPIFCARLLGVKGTSDGE